MNLILRWTIPALSCVILSCRNEPNDNDYKQTFSGLKYKIITSDRGSIVKYGQYIKYNARQMYGDSVLNDTKNTGPQNQKLDSTSMSKAAFTIFKQVRLGDSIVFKMPVDSAFKKKKPSFYKKDVRELITYLKIEEIIDSLE